MEAPSLRSAGCACAAKRRRARGRAGRSSLATKSSGEPTHSKIADGHGAGPIKVDLESSLLPGSKRSASPHTSHARDAGVMEDGELRAVHAMRSAMSERLAKFGLELHPEKTRVLRFGRYARKDSGCDGRSRPETFDFLGFTHIAGQARGGWFLLQRRTSRKKRAMKLSALRIEMRRRRHEPPAVQYRWLCLVIRGHNNYYGVPTNSRALCTFRNRVRYAWHRQLQRRSQRARWTVDKTKRFDACFPLPPPRIVHPWPGTRFAGP